MTRSNDKKDVAPNAPAFDARKAEAVVEDLRRLRKNVSLGGLDWRELRDEGRKG